MQSSQEYYHSHTHYGKDSMSEDEYIDKVTKLLRMPSVVSDASHVLTAQDSLKNNHSHASHVLTAQDGLKNNHHAQDGLKNNHGHAERYEDHQKKNSYMNHSRHLSPPEVNKKVHFIDHERNIEVDGYGKYEIYEEKSIDIEADGFIQKKHQNFDKYGSFRL